MRRYMWIVTNSSNYEDSIVVGTPEERYFYRDIRMECLDGQSCELYPRAMRPLGKRERRLRGLPTGSIPPVPTVDEQQPSTMDFNDPT